MISIHFNNQSHSLKSNVSLEEFLSHQHGLKPHCAIAINNQFIPRASYDHTLLKDGDIVDIIVPMQGG